jgi:hypothetical protein
MKGGGGAVLQLEMMRAPEDVEHVKFRELLTNYG